MEVPLFSLPTERKILWKVFGSVVCFVERMVSQGVLRSERDGTGLS